MAETIKIYRIENPNTMHGMWYNNQGVLDPYILNLTEGISKHLPMDYCPDHKLLGLDWYSAGKSKENMNQWFSLQDAKELHQNGYELFEFTVNQYQIKEHEALFTRQGVVEQLRIPIETIWDF